MGNCLFGGGLGEERPDRPVRVIRSNGGIMELWGPVAAESITAEFPGHGLFRSHDLFWRPLSGREELAPGESYFLLPLEDDGPVVRPGHVRSTSIPAESLASATYRMSVEYQGALKRSYTDVLSRYNNNNNNNNNNNVGIGNGNGNVGGAATWKVKLVISPEMLVEILAQEGRTQDLIDSVRTVAKCGSSGASASPMGLGFSDQWSFSSSRNGSSTNADHHGLVDI